MTGPTGKSAPLVPPTDPRHEQALAEYAAEFGFRLDRVLLPTQWNVFEVDGKAEVCLSADGMRTLALMTPNPSAPSIVEAVIRRASRDAYADRHAGQAANLAAASVVHRDDRGRVEDAVARLAGTGAPFTADHVHDVLAGGQPYDRNVVSSVIGVWAQRGDLREVSDRLPVASRSRSRHASRNRWWRGGDR